LIGPETAVAKDDPVPLYEVPYRVTPPPSVDEAVAVEASILQRIWHYSHSRNF